MKTNFFKKIGGVVLIIFLVFILLIFVWLIIRIILPRQLDDFNPLIQCDKNLIDKSETLMVIPIFHNVSIAENKSWCQYALSLNKTLAMHGVYHTYDEFYSTRDETYIRQGMEEFKKCFGFYPKIFEAPQVALSGQNEELLKKIGFQVKGWPNMLFRKVYHCQDSGDYSIHLFWKLRITNKLIDWI